MNDPPDEATLILHLCKGDDLRAFELVESQLSVLVMRTQVLLSLSGIVITVTGFSGRAIAQTNQFSRTCVVAGLFSVLVAAAIAMSGVLRIRWLTQSLETDGLATLRRGLAIRNQKARSLAVAGVIFVLGFGLYCAAVAQLLLAP